MKERILLSKFYNWAYAQKFHLSDLRPGKGDATHQKFERKSKNVSQIVVARLDEEIMPNNLYVKMCARFSAFQKVARQRPA